MAWWSFALLATATFLAWLMADPRIIRHLQGLARRRAISWLTGASSEDITEITAWWRAIEEREPKCTGITCVGVLQDNGSYIQGSLVSSTAGGLDYDKRELILTAPLVYITTDGTETRRRRRRGRSRVGLGQHGHQHADRRPPRLGQGTGGGVAEVGQDLADDLAARGTSGPSPVSR